MTGEQQLGGCNAPTEPVPGIRVTFKYQDGQHSASLALQNARSRNNTPQFFSGSCNLRQKKCRWGKGRLRLLFDAQGHATGGFLHLFVRPNLSHYGLAVGAKATTLPTLAQCIAFGECSPESRVPKSDSLARICPQSRRCLFKLFFAAITGRRCGRFPFTQDTLEPYTYREVVTSTAQTAPSQTPHHARPHNMGPRRHAPRA